ncbi:MAG: hypothetical protein JOZ19_07325 [Rubrobacter sp.]|nr:hypothetical protein [Rubrobacter sp.]
MRRIKAILAAVAALLMMGVLSAPAIAQDFDEGNGYGYGPPYSNYSPYNGYYDNDNYDY